MGEMENPPVTNERVAILLAQGGHPEGYRTIYDLYFEAVYRTAFRYTRSRQDAEDILQETFVKAFKNIGKFDFERSASLAAWLGRICTNSALSQLRNRRTRKDLETYSLTDSAQDPPSAGLSPEEATLHRQIAECLDKNLRLLSPRQQLMFRMKYIEGRERNEIARELGCSPNTVKKHLGRALVVLRRRLKPLWSEP